MGDWLNKLWNTQTKNYTRAIKKNEVERNVLMWKDVQYTLSEKISCRAVFHKAHICIKKIKI